jgi:DNA topoisomerase-1
MPKHLVIVESPTKARTIGRYLGPDYEVAATVGHILDLPPKELGVDLETFEPNLEPIRGKKKVIDELKKKARGAEDIILATDPDREGEAIAGHAAEVLKGNRIPTTVRRVEFREITRDAVRRALEQPRDLDENRIEAQKARRVLDRIVGYKVSPLLWKPMYPGLSAGRVQSVALRLICEREEAIRAFEPQEYWNITAHLSHAGQGFEAKLHQIDHKAFTLSSEASALEVLTDIDGLPFLVSSVKRRERRKNPPAPFTTSTLQQEAAKRLGFSARRTMQTAQRLYEGVELGSRGAVGLITYMRTDSTRVAPSAVETARTFIQAEFGDAYLPASPRLYLGKQQKGAQEAHEAIRPTSADLDPGKISQYLGRDEARLYELIWLRFVAGQMQSAVFDTTTVDFDLPGRATGRSYLFRSTGSVLRFDGFTRLYSEGREAGDHRRLDDMAALPSLEEGDEPVRTEPDEETPAIEATQHFTQPPPRFSEASLVKEMEKLGIGRPSTYAQIISTIQDREYVRVEDRRFHPTPLGETVTKFLVRLFPNLFEVDFTSRMEGTLDRVEEGEIDWRAPFKNWYADFDARMKEGEANSEAIVNEILSAEGEVCEVCGLPMMVRWNKRGRFLGCSGYPECRSTRPLDQDQAELQERVIGTDDTGKPIIARIGPYGPYLQLGEAEKGTKPRRVGLPKDTSLDSVSLEFARSILSLPRVVGTDPETGKEIEAGLGRYGPYVRLDRTYRNLKLLDQVFTVTVEEAMRLIKAEKGKAVLKALGPHPDTGVELNVLDGRYGPYVTDGKVNASLKKGADPQDLTLEEAVELLEQAAARKAKGGGRRRGRRGS